MTIKVQQGGWYFLNTMHRSLPILRQIAPFRKYNVKNISNKHKIAIKYL